MNTLSPKGYGIPKSNISEHDLKEIKNELTVKPFSPFELTSNNNEYDDKQFQVFRESSNKIYVPRNYGFKKFGKAKYQFDPSQSIKPVFK